MHGLARRLSVVQQAQQQIHTHTHTHTHRTVPNCFGGQDTTKGEGTRFNKALNDVPSLCKLRKSPKLTRSLRLL